MLYMLLMMVEAYINSATTPINLLILLTLSQSLYKILDVCHASLAIMIFCRRSRWVHTCMCICEISDVIYGSDGVHISAYTQLQSIVRTIVLYMHT